MQAAVPIGLRSQFECSRRVLLELNASGQVRYNKSGGVSTGAHIACAHTPISSSHPPHPLAVACVPSNKPGQLGSWRCNEVTVCTCLRACVPHTPAAAHRLARPTHSPAHCAKPPACQIARNRGIASGPPARGRRHSGTACPLEAHPTTTTCAAPAAATTARQRAVLTTTAAPHACACLCLPPTNCDAFKAHRTAHLHAHRIARQYHTRKPAATANPDPYTRGRRLTVAVAKPQRCNALPNLQTRHANTDH